MSFARGGSPLGQKLRHWPLAATPHKSHLVSLPVNQCRMCSAVKCPGKFAPGLFILSGIRSSIRPSNLSLLLMSQQHRAIIFMAALQEMEQTYQLNLKPKVLSESSVIKGLMAGII